jgi:hypothetical protein
MTDAFRASEPIFKWETLREIGPHDFHYRQPVAGSKCEVELTCGSKIFVWRSGDGQQYFCHGLTFGGKDGPGGAISPFTGGPVETILKEYFDRTPEQEAQPSDILVWRGPAPYTTPHSAILTEPLFDPGSGRLAYSSGLRSKNGILPEATTTLAELIDSYGESYNVYRKR